MTRYYAIAGWYMDGTYILLVHARDDGREVWGDSPLPAARWADIPGLASVRLEPTAHTVVGPWREDGETWTADVEIV